VGVAADEVNVVELNMVEVRDGTSVMLPNMLVDSNPSLGSPMLSPSSSSSESGARVQAGPGVSLLMLLLLVFETVFVVK
jgi:hypothetical protein|tara:strand:+ start:5005 stop:5241 length:237 start_codon:yes stop_codon:yes gene_type:complete